MKTTVINLRDCPPDWQTNPLYVFVGRPNARQRTHKLDGRLGNPFKIGKDGTREEVVKKHHTHALGKIAFDSEFRELVRNCHGKYLVCPGNCKPEACHADNIKELADQLQEHSSPPPTTH